MEEKKLTEKESLDIIVQMISRTKDRYVGDANIMLLWGYLTVTVAAAVWIMLAVTHNPAWNSLWFILCLAGIAMPFISKKSENNNGAKSYSDRITSGMWCSVGITAMVGAICCLGFSLLGNINSWNMMFSLALLIVPFAEIVQGIVIREKSLVAGGSVGMAIGIFIACCVAGKQPLYACWCLPVFMVAFIAMMIVPGHILKYKNRHINERA